MAVAPSRAIAPAAVEVADRTWHHIAVRLLPFLFILYITNYLDRTSVAYAALGMSRDLRFSDRVFGIGAGIFFISYVALQIPGALLVRLAHRRKQKAVAHLEQAEEYLLRRRLTGVQATTQQPKQRRLATNPAATSSRHRRV